MRERRGEDDGRRGGDENEGGREMECRWRFVNGGKEEERGLGVVLRTRTRMGDDGLRVGITEDKLENWIGTDESRRRTNSGASGGEVRYGGTWVRTLSRWTRPRTSTRTMERG